jgi:hypothetical protein
MIHPGMPRIPPVDEDGRLLWDWRKELSRKRCLKGTIVFFLVLLEFLGLFLIVREVLPQSTFEPHLGVAGAISVWVILSFALTALTFVSLSWCARRIHRHLST